MILHNITFLFLCVYLYIYLHTVLWGYEQLSYALRLLHWAATLIWLSLFSIALSKGLSILTLWALSICSQKGYNSLFSPFLDNIKLFPPNLQVSCCPGQLLEGSYYCGDSKLLMDFLKVHQPKNLPI